jgi:hypothetical protein
MPQLAKAQDLMLGCVISYSASVGGLVIFDTS